MPDVYASIETADHALQERVAVRELFGHIAYASLIGRRP